MLFNDIVIIVTFCPPIHVPMCSVMILNVIFKHIFTHIFTLGSEILKVVTLKVASKKLFPVHVPHEIFDMKNW